MQTKSEKRFELVVIPCSCDAYPGRLTAAAALALQREKGIRLIDAGNAGELARLNKETLLSGTRVVAVDGCGEQCVQKQLAAKKIDVEFYLNLADLAIEERQLPEIDVEDLELAKDGIVAAAARAVNPLPRLPGCCC